jgi:hypothetical protein
MKTLHTHTNETKSLTQAHTYTHAQILPDTYKNTSIFLILTKKNIDEQYLKLCNNEIEI